MFADIVDSTKHNKSDSGRKLVNDSKNKMMGLVQNSPDITFVKSVGDLHITFAEQPWPLFKMAGDYMKTAASGAVAHVRFGIHHGSSIMTPTNMISYHTSEMIPARDFSGPALDGASRMESMVAYKGGGVALTPEAHALLPGPVQPKLDPVTLAELLKAAGDCISTQAKLHGISENPNYTMYRGYPYGKYFTM